MEIKWRVRAPDATPARWRADGSSPLDGALDYTGEADESADVTRPKNYSATSPTSSVKLEGAARRSSSPQKTM